MPRLRRRISLVLLATLSALVGWWLAMEPSNQRPWSPDNARVAWAEFRGDSIFVHNVRNTRYRTTSDFDVAWENRAYDLRELRSVWFGVEPFSRDWRGPAHTFVSFGFADGRFLAASVEIRRERGEIFSPLRGILNQFEIIYVLADERDVVRLRTNYRNDNVYLYPVRTTPENMRTALVDVLQRANRLRQRPEFYNTLWNNCTTNLARHVNRIAPGRVPRSYRLVLPGYSDEMALELGLLDTDLPIEQARRRFHINDRAHQHADAPDFSQRIRAPSASNP